MLTGDKGATAQQIGKNAGLLRGEVLTVPESGRLDDLVDNMRRTIERRSTQNQGRMSASPASGQAVGEEDEKQLLQLKEP